MLPFIRVTLHVLFCFAGLQTLAQCGYSGVNYGDVTPPGVGSTVSYPFYVWGGDQYSLVANAGCTYQVSMCGTSWDTQITVFDPALGVAAYNDDFCGLASQVTFTAAVSGIYTIQVNQYFCGTNFTAAEVFNVTLVSCASVGGCNNPAACNYDPAATNAANCCFSNCVNFSAGGGFFDNEISWSIADANGVVMGSGIATPNTLLCLPDGCYTITLFDSFGDGWNGAFWQATLNGVVLGTGSMNDGSLSFGYLEVGAVDCGFPEPIQVQTGIYSAQQLISDVFLGDCLEAMNIQFSGADAAIGTFSNGGDIGIEEGIVLTTGNALGAVGPNTSGSETAIMGTGSSLLLEAMTGEWTYDAVEFTFDFVASTSQVTFDYVFASDEYPEFVCSFNDAFAFFVSGP
ncbi:MAG: hypothetical protein RL226_363, partial [Bacteroidota bacterium]